jgi:putative ABC transport system permease protein
MFFLTYVRRELWRRRRQAIVIALGLALGIGLVITATAAAAGVRNAQGNVLKGLYGVGTDVTVTKKPPAASPAAGTRVQLGNGGARVCSNGACHTGAQKIDNLRSPAYGPISESSVASVRGLRGVTGASGGLSLTDNQITIPGTLTPSTMLPSPKSISVDGTDISHPKLGPLSNGTISSGRTFSGSDANSDVALVDADYAAANRLRAGSKITLARTSFRVIGIVSQPQSSNPPNVYIPLARAQALGKNNQDKSLRGQVNTIYVATASAADVGAVQHELSGLLPSATVTTSSSLASQVTGSLANTAKLANDLGRWLSVLVLVAAFAVASLLTVAAVSRRVREFGTLKALGWRSRRIVLQVMGEAIVIGIVGGAAGVGLGYLGVMAIKKISPTLDATVTQPTGQHFVGMGPNGATSSSPTVSHTVPVHMLPQVSPAVIALAVGLAIAGGLIAGMFGSWQVSRLHPAAALARVE